MNRLFIHFCCLASSCFSGEMIEDPGLYIERAKIHISERCYQKALADLEMALGTPGIEPLDQLKALLAKDYMYLQLDMPYEHA